MNSDKNWTTIIKPKDRLLSVDFGELWRYRDLCMLFVKRNNPDATRYLSYLYLICLVACRDILKYSLLRRLDLAKATIKGIRDFVSLNS